MKLGRRAGWFDEFFEGLEGFSNGIRRPFWKFYRDGGILGGFVIFSFNFLKTKVNNWL